MSWLEIAIRCLDLLLRTIQVILMVLVLMHH